MHKQWSLRCQLNLISLTLDWFSSGLASNDFVSCSVAPFCSFFMINFILWDADPRTCAKSTCTFSRVPVNSKGQIQNFFMSLLQDRQCPILVFWREQHHLYKETFKEKNFEFVVKHCGVQGERASRRSAVLNVDRLPGNTHVHTYPN